MSRREPVRAGGVSHRIRSNHHRDEELAVKGLEPLPAHRKKRCSEEDRLPTWDAGGPFYLFFCEFRKSWIMTTGRVLFRG